VSKWIHLNGGDAGLKRFFERVYAALVPGGTFVLEAQPRESYIKARKLHPVSERVYPPFVSGELNALPRRRLCKRTRRGCRYSPKGLRMYYVRLGLNPRRGSVSLGKAVSAWIYRRGLIVVVVFNESFSGFRRPVDLYVK
jgi:hypothetical protein